MDVICPILGIYILVLFGRIIMSYVRVVPGTPLASVSSVLFSLTEPVLAPLRSAIPPVRLGAAAIDLSPIIVFVVIRLIC
jgi:YggT family protein